MIEIIPAIDLIEGQTVRLTQGDYRRKTVYETSPLRLAEEFEQIGFKRLHIVDLDGARSSHIVNHPTLLQISSRTNLRIDFGGGIKTSRDIETAFASGAAMVTVGSIAVKNPSLFEEWLSSYGPDRIILGADVRDGLISISGWKEDSGQKLLPFLKNYVSMGVTNVLCTDISRDGMLSGPSIDLYQEILSCFPSLHLIASGGISSIDDIDRLDRAGVPAVVFGKAIYEGKIDLNSLKQYL